MSHPSAPADLLIRPAREEDARELAGLLVQLGYPSSDEAARARLSRLGQGERRLLIVAVLGGAVVGLAVGEIHDVLTSDEPVGKLNLLVVDERMRGQGIGRRLLGAFEEWAQSCGARRVSLTSASRREAAHAFYRAAGWELTGMRFGRYLESPEIA